MDAPATRRVIRPSQLRHSIQCSDTRRRPRRLMRRAVCWKVGAAGGRQPTDAAALRMFLRFLMPRCCAAELVGVHWRIGGSPPPGTCHPTTSNASLRLRYRLPVCVNRAILLLLALFRAAISCSCGCATSTDGAWILVCEGVVTRLPLTQEVGQALVTYQASRPRTVLRRSSSAIVLRRFPFSRGGLGDCRSRLARAAVTRKPRGRAPAPFRHCPCCATAPRSKTSRASSGIAPSKPRRSTPKSTSSLRQTPSRGQRRCRHANARRRVVCGRPSCGRVTFKSDGSLMQSRAFWRPEASIVARVHRLSAVWTGRYRSARRPGRYSMRSIPPRRGRVPRIAGGGVRGREAATPRTLHPVRRRHSATHPRGCPLRVSHVTPGDLQHVVLLAGLHRTPRV